MYDLGYARIFSVVKYLVLVIFPAGTHVFNLCAHYKILTGATFAMAFIISFSQDFHDLNSFSFTPCDFDHLFNLLSVFVEGGPCKLNSSTRKTITEQKTNRPRARRSVRFRI